MSRVVVILCSLSLICLVSLGSAGMHTGHAASPTNAPGPYTPSTPLRFDYLSLEHGLSQSVVLASYQDSQGYLWFGTQDGLNRYDGYHFTIFRPDSDNPYSLTDRYILAITGDAAGNLWIGTTQGGLSYYDHQTGHFIHYLNDPADPKSLGGNCIRTLYLASSGLLWIGSDGGVDVLDPKTGIFTARYRHDPEDLTSLLSNEVYSVLEDSEGKIWIGLDEGLERLDPVSGSLTHFKYDPEDPTSLVNAKVTAIVEDHRGDLWLGTSFGLERFDRQSLGFEHFKAKPEDPSALSNAKINTILEDRVGNLWVGTEDGLNLLDRQSGHFTIYRPDATDPTSLNNATIRSLYEDREGLLWIGTFGGGVSKLDRGRNKFPLLQYDPAQPKNIPSFGLTEDHTGQLWFAMWNEGVLRLNRTTGDFTLYRHDPDDPVNGLLDNFVWNVSESRDGTIWIGSSMGLNALNPETGQFTHYTSNEQNSDDPKSLHGRTVLFTMEDSHGYLWVVTSDGLDRLDRRTGIFTHYKHDPADPSSLSTPSVATIFESRSGEIWLGYFEGGLSHLDQQTGRFTHYHHDPKNSASLSIDAVYMIHEDQTGMLWLATSYGLDKFDVRTGTFTHYTTKNGLPNDVIYAILEDEDGYYWLSTNFGLARFDPRAGTSQNYDFNDGLQSNEFNSYAATRTHSGELIFSGISGTNIFFPRDIPYNEYVPPLVITNLTQGGEPISTEGPAEVQSEVTLRWPHNYFEFEFAALSFADPAQNRYAYRLEPFDEDWLDNGTFHFGRYTNLSGGNYTLHIKGSNNDGIWNETATSIKITVVPPAWQTWWFRLGVVLLLLAGAFVGYRLRVRSIEARSRYLEQQVETRTREIEALFEQTKELAIIEERNRLARDLHDSAKQKAFAALAQLGVVRRLLQIDPDSAKKHVEEVENLVDEVIQELSFLIQEMYPLALKEKGLVVSLREYIYEWENRSGIRALLQVQQQRRLPLKIEQALYRIIQESLANIARHSRANRVTIELNYNQSAVELVIRDDGCGFDLDQKPAGIGLRSMQERASMIGGQFAIESVPGGGTQILVRTPVEAEPLVLNSV